MSFTTIIYAHPYDQSFNHGILRRVQQLLDEKGEKYQLIDLYADGFNPAYTKEELALFNQGKALDPLVLHYQELLKTTNRLIFIFPIWWADMPAIVKGFLDKVLLKQFAYVESKTGLSGRMGRGMAGAAQSGRMRRQKLLSAGTMDYVFSLLGIDGVGRTGPLKRPAVPVLLVPRLFGD